jgi:hypothetical protein
MTWNHRVTKQVRATHTEYGISEVYYDKKGKIIGWTDPVQPYGESRKELRKELKHMLKAFKHPVLDITDEDKPKEG